MYQFNLEPLLRHRRFIEEHVHKEFVALQCQLEEEERALTKLVEREMELMNNFREIKEKGASGSMLGLYQDFFEQLSQEIHIQAASKREVQKKLDQKRDDLMEAMKKRKALERLKEKGLQAYQRKILRQEQNLLGEIAITRFNRTHKR
jgi:flagellar protein FliJ